MTLASLISFKLHLLTMLVIIYDHHMFIVQTTVHSVTQFLKYISYLIKQGHIFLDGITEITWIVRQIHELHVYLFGPQTRCELTLVHWLHAILNRLEANSSSLSQTTSQISLHMYKWYYLYEKLTTPSKGGIRSQTFFRTIKFKWSGHTWVCIIKLFLAVINSVSQKACVCQST
jgi:hypothetical protein